MKSPHHPLWIIHFEDGLKIAKTKRSPFYLSSSGGFQNLHPEIEVQSFLKNEKHELNQLALFYRHLQELDLLIKKLKNLIDDQER